MANRFWVGGTGTWDNSTTTHWSTTSGGSGGASVPGSADTAVFDANSGAGNVTVGNISNPTGSFSAAASSVGFLGTNNISFITGNITLPTGGSGIFGANSGSAVLFGPYNGTCNFTSNGWTLAALYVGFAGFAAATTINLQDNMTVSTSGVLIGDTGNTGTQTFNLNGHNLAYGNSGFQRLAGTTPISITGTGTISGNSWSSFTPTVSFGASVLLQLISSTPTFAGNGGTYNNVEIQATGSIAAVISGSNTINTLTLDSNATATAKVNFTAGTTQTVTSFVVSSSSGHIVVLESSSNGSAWTLSVASGTVSVDNVTIQDSTATGGATFNAGAHSNDLGDNSGWFFSVRFINVTDTISISDVTSTPHIQKLAPIPSVRAASAPYAVVNGISYIQSALGGGALPLSGTEITNLVTFRIYNNFSGLDNTATMDNVYVTVYDDAGPNSFSAAKSPVSQSWVRIYETGFGESTTSPGLYTQYTDEDTAIGKGGGDVYVPAYGSDGTTTPHIRAGTDTNGVGFIEFATYVEAPDIIGFASYTFAVALVYDWTS